MGLFDKLKKGLSKTATGIGDTLRGAVGLPNGRVDADTLQDLEDALIMADVGVDLAAELIEKLSKKRFADGATTDDVKLWLAEQMTEILQPLEAPLTLPDEKPAVLLFVGVNGSGKTTTIGKLAAQFTKDGKKTLLAAGDTFRAGAAEQLHVWAERAGLDLVRAEKDGADPAGLLFKAYEQADEQGLDVLMCDTAGRLQNRTDLMEELAKILRVLKKKNEAAPHRVILALDATVGQNALQQARAFSEMANVTGLVVTKLDSSAKAGIILALGREFNLPIHYIGVGEAQEDLQPFVAADFAKALLDVAQ